MNEQQVPAGLKAHLTAQYHDQQVLCIPGVIYRAYWPNIQTLHRNGDFDKSWLQLRSLSSLTDSELKQVVALALSFPNTNEDELIGIDEVFIDNIDKLDVEIRFDISVRCWEGRFIINHLNGNLYTVNEEDDSEGLFNTLAVYQYLQQQGFALPVYYKGILYTVDQLTEMGIYKLV
jgi:hypothetical protein